MHRIILRKYGRMLTSIGCRVFRVSTVFKHHGIDTMSEPQDKWVGRRVPRKEDLRLLAGRGRYIDDIRLPNMKHAAILRSPYPHAWIKSIDSSRALDAQGVRAVLTGEDVARTSNLLEGGLEVYLW